MTDLLQSFFVGGGQGWGEWGAVNLSPFLSCSPRIQLWWNKQKGRFEWHVLRASVTCFLATGTTEKRHLWLWMERCGALICRKKKKKREKEWNKIITNNEIVIIIITCYPAENNVYNKVSVNLVLVTFGNLIWWWRWCHFISSKLIGAQ